MFQIDRILAESELRVLEKYYGRGVRRGGVGGEREYRPGHPHHEVLRLQGENRQGLCPHAAGRQHSQTVGEFPHQQRI